MHSDILKTIDDVKEWGRFAILLIGSIRVAIIIWSSLAAGLSTFFIGLVSLIGLVFTLFVWTILCEIAKVPFRMEIQNAVIIEHLEALRFDKNEK